MVAYTAADLKADRLRNQANVKCQAAAGDSVASLGDIKSEGIWNLLPFLYSVKRAQGLILLLMSQGKGLISRGQKYAKFCNFDLVYKNQESIRLN